MDRSRPGSSRSGRALIENEESAHTLREKAIQNADESSCCFSLKGAMVTTILTSVIFVLLILILDVTIWQAEKFASYQSSTNVLEIKIDGTPKDLIKIDSFEHYQPSEKYYTKIKIVDLSYVEVDIGELERLFHEEYYLEILRLKNVKLKGKFGRGKYFYRSHSIKEFYLELNQNIGPYASFQLDQCDQCVVQENSDNLDRFQGTECMKTLFHLIKPYPNFETDTNSITFPSNLGETKITIKINGWTYFQYDPEAGEFATTLKNCNNILKGLKHNLRKLAIKNCRDLEYSTLSRFACCTTHLTLDTVNIKGIDSNQTLSQLLGQFAILEELVFKAGAYQVIDTNKQLEMSSYIVRVRTLARLPQNSINLNELPLSLKNITLSNIRAIANETIQLKLDQLGLHSVTFADTTTQKVLLNTNSAQCKRIAWEQSLSDLSTSLPYTQASTVWWSVLADMLINDRNDNLEWIFLEKKLTSRFDRNGIRAFIKLAHWDEQKQLSGKEGFSLILTKDFSRDNSEIPWNIQEKIPQENTERVKLIWSEFFNMNKFLDPKKIIDSQW